MLCNWNLVKGQGESSETPIAEAVQAALLGHGKERIPGGHKAAYQKLRGFIEKMDLGTLLRCSVEEKGHKLKKKKKTYKTKQISKKIIFTMGIN